MAKYRITLAKVTDVHAREVFEVRCPADDDAIILAKEKLLRLEPFALGFYVKCQRVKTYNETKVYNQIYYASYSQVLTEVFNEKKQVNRSI